MSRKIFQDFQLSRAMVTSSSRPQNSCDVGSNGVRSKKDHGYEVFSDPKLHWEPAQGKSGFPAWFSLTFSSGKETGRSEDMLQVQEFLEEGYESIILRLLGSGGKIWRFLKRDWKADSGAFRPGLWDTRSSFHEEEAGWNRIVLSRCIGVVWLFLGTNYLWEVSNPKLKATRIFGWKTWENYTTRAEPTLVLMPGQPNSKCDKRSEMRLRALDKHSI